SNTIELFSWGFPGATNCTAASCVQTLELESFPSGGVYPEAAELSHLAQQLRQGTNPVQGVRRGVGGEGGVGACPALEPPLVQESCEGVDVDGCLRALLARHGGIANTDG